jgi:dephospho-CoA kinase
MRTVERVKTIGLLGGVASGKSLVAGMLVELGAGLLDADRTGHAVLAEDTDVHTALRKRWGGAVFSPEGVVDRTIVATRVFANTPQAAADREFLEVLLHPRIRQRLEEMRQHFAAEGKSAVVLDAPLLLEAGWGSLCNIILMIDVPREIRLDRARQRGWSEAEFSQREAAQLPVDEKRRAAHCVIENDGSIEELRAAVSDFWQRYVAAQ